MDEKNSFPCITCLYDNNGKVIGWFPTEQEALNYINFYEKKNILYQYENVFNYNNTLPIINKYSKLYFSHLTNFFF
jgi:hypothetical protein